MANSKAKKNDTAAKISYEAELWQMADALRGSMDARKLGVLVDRTHRELTEEGVARIAGMYHLWRGEKVPPFEKGGAGGIYQDIPGFCKSATIEEISKHSHVLTPGRYVRAEAQEDDGEPFEEKMRRLTATLREQQTEAVKLDAAIVRNLKELGYGR